jgi:hypothetical protein
MPSPEHVRLRLMLLGQRRDEEAISRTHPYMGYVRLDCQLKPGDRRFCWSRADLWAWLDLNQRPHPYQLNAGNRCADRPFPGHLRPSGPKVCVQSAHWCAFIHSTPGAGGIAASSTSYSACNSLIECTRECWPTLRRTPPPLDWHAPTLASIGIVRLVARLRSVLPPGHRSHGPGAYGDELLAFAVALASGARTAGQQLDLGAPDPVRITAGIARPEQPLLPRAGFL